MNDTALGYIPLLALATLPGLHYDLIRGRRNGMRPRSQIRPQFNRVVIAGTLITAVTLMLLGALRSAGPDSMVSLQRLVDDTGDLVRAPLAGSWTVVCFIAVSLTTSALFAAVAGRLESNSGLFSGLGDQTAHSNLDQRPDYTDRDIELEVKLNSGHTYRGLLGEGSGGRVDDVRFITLYGPIFALDDHGKPLPLDALHWDQMVVPTRAIVSVLIRPVEEPPLPPTVPLRSRQSRHSVPRANLTDRLVTIARDTYENRFAPRLLTKLLIFQIVTVAAVGGVSRFFT